MVDINRKRASGQTAGEDAAKEINPALTIDDIERKKIFRRTNFSRMRTDWHSEDRIVIEKANRLAQERLFKEFKDGFNILSWVYDTVRIPDADQDGELILENGLPTYQRNEFGVYIEDYSLLTNKKRDDLLFAISTRLFGWEQKSQDAWHEAMQSKAQWEERFAIGFDAPETGRQGDREAAGQVDSADERYFAIFMTAYSRKCESFINSMKALQNILIKQLNR